MTIRELLRFVAHPPLACCAALLGMAGAYAQTAPADAPVAAPTAEQRAEQLQSLKAALARGELLTPNQLGSYNADLVYTPITPCRAADTRATGAGGPLVANTARLFDIDGSNFASQGGSTTGCGVPLNVAYAVAVTLHAVSPSAAGYLKAWIYGGSKPTASVLDFVAGQTAASTTIVSIIPGTGGDFNVASSVGTHLIVDVVGYYAAPVATALDCSSIASAATVVAYNVYTAVDAVCPAGTTVTGGGTYPVEGTLGRPNIWTDGSPYGNSWRTWVDNQTGSNRSVQTYARCCRVPGR